MNIIVVAADQYKNLARTLDGRYSGSGNYGEMVIHQRKDRMQMTAYGIREDEIFKDARQKRY